MASSTFPALLAGARDLALSVSGDLIIGDDGDLDTVEGETALLQEVLVRLRTRKGDARYAQGMGASLDTLKGQPNSPETGQAAEKLVSAALTHDGLFAPEALSVIAMPTSETTIALVITGNTSSRGAADSGEVLSIEVTIDLQEGLLL
jgi:hypothetical protein